MDKKLIQEVVRSLNKTLLSTYTALYRVCVRTSSESKPMCLDVYLTKQSLHRVLVRATLTLTFFEYKTDFLLYSYVHNLSSVGLLRCVEFRINTPISESLLSNGQCIVITSVRSERSILERLWLILKPVLAGLRQVEVRELENNTRLICFTVCSSGRFLAAGVVIRADKVCIEDRGTYAVLKSAHARISVRSSTTSQTYLVEIQLIRANPVFMTNEWFLALSELTRKYGVEESSFSSLCLYP